MLTLILISTFVLAVAAVAAMHAVPRLASGGTTSSGWSLDWVRIGAGTFAVLFLAWGVTATGFHIARASAVTYYEYWSGFEKDAWIDTTVCTKDGPCVNEYDCDSYTVWVDKTRQVQDGYTERRDSKGNVTRTPKYKTEHYKVRETRWHSCPYVTHEYTYKVSDDLGDTHTMGSHWFPANPTAHRWTGSGYNDARFGFGAPGLPNVSSGEPAPWKAAKARLDAGTPGGVTKQVKYPNFILASADDIYAEASDQIDTLKADGLLPKVVEGTHDYYRADKVYAVGDLPGSDTDWQDAALRFNGAFGGQKQGDLHVIVVTDPRVTDPDAYTGAVQAYWQSEELGKHALSKNGYVVVLGSNGVTVNWARGFSGMPAGNEAVDVAMREDLTGTALTPTAILGTAATPTSGAIGATLFDPVDGFERVQMADYAYLFDGIQPGGVAKTLIVTLTLFLGAGLWLLIGMAPPMSGLVPSGSPRRDGEPRKGWTVTRSFHSDLFPRKSTPTPNDPFDGSLGDTVGDPFGYRGGDEFGDKFGDAFDDGFDGTLDNKATRELDDLDDLLDRINRTDRF